MGRSKIVSVWIFSPLVVMIGCGALKTQPGQSQVGLSNPVPAETESTMDVNRTKESPAAQISDKDQEASEFFERALQSLQNGQEDKALKDLETVISLDTAFSAPHNNLGILYKRKGLLDMAIREYQEAIRLKPDYAEAYHNLGIAYREKGLFKEAERAYLEAVRLRPDLAEAHFNLGILYELYLNRPEEAIRHYREHLKHDGRRKQEVDLWILALEQKLQTAQPSP